MYFVTLGHFLASSWASALVTLRQLLSPKPSARASVIFFDPHQDGAPATGWPPPEPLGFGLGPPPPPPPPPHAARMSATDAHATETPSLNRPLRDVLMTSLAPPLDGHRPSSSRHTADAWPPRHRRDAADALASERSRHHPRTRPQGTL